MSTQDRLNQLNSVEGTEETRYKEELERGEQKKSEAEKDIEDDNMNHQLETIALQTGKLLQTMLKQLEKEDSQRKKLINFFIFFTVAITLLPVIIVAIVLGVREGCAGTAESLALVCAFVNIPVSTIGVLRSIAKCLFNDTYRKTLPDMIRNITEALSKYNTMYRGKGNTVID